MRRRRMDGSMARPFFVSFRVKWRCGPVEREPLLPVIPMGVDVGAFGDEGLGEVAIAEGDGAVTDGDKEAGTIVVTDMDDLAVGNGIGGFVVGTEVDAAMEGTLAGERVGAVAEGAGDDEVAERANHCEAGGGVGGGR